ncbi:MAG: hypothetical protein AAGG07_11715 [Planctomycetota bacterium]
MLQPAPITKLPAHLARGKLAEHLPETATKPERVVITFPNTSYRTELIPTGTIQCELGKRIHGVIRAEARRADKVGSGGRYVEPVFGRPRRVQGHVLANDFEPGTILVHAGVPIVCTLTDARQKPEDFEQGDFVSFDVHPGATFEQRDPPA